jgi:hypothetical protein
MTENIATHGDWHIHKRLDICHVPCHPCHRRPSPMCIDLGGEIDAPLSAIS